MNKIAIIVIALGMFTTTNVLAADVPMQCNLTCKTDYSTPQAAADERAAVIAESAGMAEPATVDELLAKQVMVADASKPFEPATAAVTGIPLSAEADSDTGGFDFVTECVKYQGKIWAWREGKCKSMSPDWQSPGLGNYVKH